VVEGLHSLFAQKSFPLFFYGVFCMCVGSGGLEFGGLRGRLVGIWAAMAMH